jgi:hypothetical protein
MTQTITLWPIIKALSQAALFLTPGAQNPPADWHTQWRTANTTQQQFVQTYLSQQAGLSSFKPDELKAWASTDYQELNNILKKEGFAIELSPFFPPDFGVVAILDVMMKWLTPGDSIDIRAKDGKTYPGAYFKRNFSVFTSPRHRNPIARLETQSGETAWLTIANKFNSEWDMLSYIKDIKENLAQDSSYDRLHFPKINLDVQPNIEWLIGMGYDIFAISQAKQQTKLKMNEFGAHVKSAVALIMATSSPYQAPPKELVIDQPFLFWIEKPGVSIPVFAGYLDTDVWSDPGSLDMEPNTKSGDQNTEPVAPAQPEQALVLPEQLSWWQQVRNAISTRWAQLMNWCCSK